MKTMAKKILVLGLLVCLLSISSADNTVAPSTNEVTQPGGQTTNDTNNDAPSIKDLQKTSDPSFVASKLKTPAKLIFKTIYYSVYYTTFYPIKTAVYLMLEPFFLAYYAISAPFKLFLGPIINPVASFGAKQYMMTKYLIRWTILQSISLGSGATATSVSKAMQLSMNGIIRFFTDVLLPVANSAEKLSKLTDDLSKSRTRRSIVGTVGGGVKRVASTPFVITKYFLSIVTLPFRIAYRILTWPIRFIFGGDDSTYTLLLTDMSTERITNMVLNTGWKYMRDIAIPQFAILADKLKDNEAVPKQFRVWLSDFVAIYKIMQTFGFLK